MHLNYRGSILDINQKIHEGQTYTFKMNNYIVHITAKTENKPTEYVINTKIDKIINNKISPHFASFLHRRPFGVEVEEKSGSDLNYKFVLSEILH